MQKEPGTASIISASSSNSSKRIKIMTIYVKYDKTPEALPVAVGGTVKELAKILGVSENLISSSISKKYPSYARIEIEEGDDEEE